MKIAFAVIGMIFVLFALGSCVAAKTSMHEIAGLITLLIGCIFIAVAFLLEQIGMVIQRMNDLGRVLLQIRDRLPPKPNPPPADPRI